MIKASWFGVFIALAVLYFGVFRTAPNPAIFLDSHAIILVLGGTLAVTLIAFPLQKLEDIVSLIIFGVLKKKKATALEQAKDLVRLANLRFANQPINISNTEKHPFMREALHLLVKEHLDADELKSVLVKRSDFFKKKYTEDAKTLNAIGKFPPAFGLLGASTGMIAMMANIGQGQQDKIGDAMAIALVATFWGIAIANFILLPLADFASRVVIEDQHVRYMIIDGIVLIRKGEDPRVVMEKLLAYLPPHYRTEVEPLVNVKPVVPGLNVVPMPTRNKAV
jgi:chemotaxis protein MotA